LAGARQSRSEGAETGKRGDLKNLLGENETSLCIAQPGVFEPSAGLELYAEMQGDQPHWSLFSFAWDAEGPDWKRRDARRNAGRGKVRDVA
jgi:hypothetical protein